MSFVMIKIHFLRCFCGFLIESGEVCSLIDDGKNPDEFTKEVLNSCIAKNQITKGKTDAFKVIAHHDFVGRFN